MKNIILGAVVLLVAFSTGGCVVGRRTVSLPVPHAASLPAASKGEFVVLPAEDGRHFENKPPSPSTPSIDGDVKAVSADQLATMIGRQRNGYGHAMGDVGLTAPETVKSKLLELVKEGLTRSGYSVSNGSGGNNTISVKIDEFWAWFTPKFVAVQFEARLQSTLTIKSGDKSANVVVKGYGSNHGQVASDANWQLAYNRAFEDFLKNFELELTKAGF